MQIKSKIQEDNAKIEREKNKIEKEIEALKYKKSNLTEKLDQISNQNLAIEDKQRNSQNVDEIERRKSVKGADLVKLKDAVIKNQ